MGLLVAAPPFGKLMPGVLERWAKSLFRGDAASEPKLWRFSQTLIALSAFIIMAGANLRMLNDALRNGPLWYRDYGLGGLQYGGFQIFDVMDQYTKEHPDAQILVAAD